MKWNYYQIPRFHPLVKYFFQLKTHTPKDEISEKIYYFSYWDT